MSGGRRDGGPPSGGALRPTTPADLAPWAFVSLVAGWLLHLVAERLGTPPLVAWTQPALLYLLAAMVGYTAWTTWRTLHVHQLRIPPARAVNRLQLARAGAVVGAVTAGGYLGYALSWIGSQDHLAGARGRASAVAAFGGVLLVVAALLLERACRVRKDDPER